MGDARLDLEDGIAGLAGALKPLPAATAVRQRRRWLAGALGLAGLAVVAALLVGGLVYRELNWTRLREAIIDGAVQTGAVMLLVAASARTLARNVDWRDDLSLWTSAVDAVPRSAKAHARLAYALAERHGPGADHLDRILAEAETALAIVENPPLPDVDVPTMIPLDLGVYYQAKGAMVGRARGDERTPEAVDWYHRAALVLERAAAVDRAKNAQAETPIGNWEVYERLGQVRLVLAEPGPAAAAFATMRRLSPASPAAHLGMARAELGLDRPGEAAVSLLRVVALDPGNAEAWRLLLDVYAGLDPGGCAIAVSGGQPRLDPGCPLVHDHLCAAYEGLAALHREAGQAEIARRLEARAVGDHGCPVGAAAAPGHP